MPNVRTSQAKQQRMRRLSNNAGVIGALAIDQRKSLRRMIAEARGVVVELVPDSEIVAFKTAVTEVLSPHSTAILLDVDYGLPATEKRDANCGLLLAYEADGYENPRPNRALALAPDLSVYRLQQLGADGVKILLHWSADDPEDANDAKKVLIERIGAECEACGLPFFLEPVLYDPAHPLIQGEVSPAERAAMARAFAMSKPQQVIDMMREFAQPRYRVDVLKVEFPVVARYVEGSSTAAGESLYSHDEAMRWYRAADAAAAGVPYIYLSAGVSTDEFRQSIRYAIDAQTSFNGVLCGRANWQDGVPAFVQGGIAAFRRWLASDGVANLQALNELLAQARPWDSAAPAGQA